MVVNGDTFFEPNETFFVNISNVTGATIIDGQGVGTINNDDCPAAPDVVISQVYGGGGNAGAPLQSDFIELFNRGVTPVNLAGWSVQYQSATGTGTWQVTPLTGTIAPGGYYLVKEDTGTGCSGLPCGAPLPAADATGTIAMAAGAGKVALTTTITPFSGSCASCAVDIVGYGATASCFEGAGPTAGLTNTTAALRKRSGCFDSDNNNVDFSTGAPNPRNTSSPTNSCAPLSLIIQPDSGQTGQRRRTSEFSSAPAALLPHARTMVSSCRTPQLTTTAIRQSSEALFVFTSSCASGCSGRCSCSARHSNRVL